ncbi:hypothetical protein SDC9_198516 [bioreactor metagenome]|uniref:Uncharacterized protein n=1 Tax=bioreactor metagenome TaxID=1076179 RepID=A0A645IIR4_9ZZZZ
MRLIQCLFNDGVDGTDMLARSDLWEDAAVFFVDLDLGGDDAGEQLATVLNDSGCGLITGRFNTQNTNFFVCHRALFQNLLYR